MGQFTLHSRFGRVNSRKQMNFTFNDYRITKALKKSNHNKERKKRKKRNLTPNLIYVVDRILHANSSVCVCVSMMSRRCLINPCSVVNHSAPPSAVSLKHGMWQSERENGRCTWPLTFGSQIGTKKSFFSQEGLLIDSFSLQVYLNHKKWGFIYCRKFINWLLPSFF